MQTNPAALTARFCFWQPELARTQRMFTDILDVPFRVTNCRFLRIAVSVRIYSVREVWFVLTSHLRQGGFAADNNTLRLTNDLRSENFRRAYTCVAGLHRLENASCLTHAHSKNLHFE